MEGHRPLAHKATSSTGGLTNSSTDKPGPRSNVAQHAMMQWFRKHCVMGMPLYQYQSQSHCYPPLLPVNGQLLKILVHKIFRGPVGRVSQAFVASSARSCVLDDSRFSCKVTCPYAVLEMWSWGLCTKPTCGYSLWAFLHLLHPCRHEHLEMAML